jgi:hypothetical protein
MPDQENILVAFSGVVYVAPTTAAAPVDALAPLDASFKELGFISDEGLAVNFSAEFTTRSSWTSVYPASFDRDGNSVTVLADLLEFSKETIEYAHEDDVTGSSPNFAARGKVVGDDLRKSLVAEWQDGITAYRLYLPVGVVTKVGAMQLSRTGAAVTPFVFEGTSEDGDPWVIFITEQQYQLDYAVDAVIRAPQGITRAHVPSPVRQNYRYSRILINILPTTLSHTVDAVISGDTPQLMPIKGRDQYSTPRRQRSTVREPF